MNPTDRKRAQILVVLAVVLAAALWLGQQIYAPPADGTIETVESVVAADVDDVLAGVSIPGGFDPTAPAGPGTGGRRNLFDYAPAPVPEPVFAPPPPVVSAPPQPLAPPADPAPPPPPPVPFRYSGLSRIGPDGQLQAWLFDGQRRFGATEQEVLMGRYRVNAITEAFVEVEDLEFNRRQRLPLLAQ